MSRKKKSTRINEEKNRLTEIYKNIDGKKKSVVEGLIERCAYMRVTLDDFEEDLDKNGFTEKFQQGRDQTPYDRKRPIAEMYNSMNTSYQKATKQLSDMLPKTTDAIREDDGFDSFVDGRDDL